MMKCLHLFQCFPSTLMSSVMFLLVSIILFFHYIFTCLIVVLLNQVLHRGGLISASSSLCVRNSIYGGCR